MSGEKTKYKLEMDDERITVTWRPLPAESLLAHKDELRIHFNYRIISSDTVLAMMWDMKAPDRLCDAVMTRLVASSA